jgi:hypothetical protein
VLCHEASGTQAGKPFRYHGPGGQLHRVYWVTRHQALSPHETPEERHAEMLNPSVELLTPPAEEAIASSGILFFCCLLPPDPTSADRCRWCLSLLAALLYPLVPFMDIAEPASLPRLRYAAQQLVVCRMPYRSVAPGASAFLMLSLFIGLVTVDLALLFLLVFLPLDLYLTPSRTGLRFVVSPRRVRDLDSISLPVAGSQGFLAGSPFDPRHNIVLWNNPLNLTLSSYQ